jgi:hypothetical protein
MRRRRLFALAGGASAAVALPAVAAPGVEMHVNDVTPLITIRRPMREQLIPGFQVGDTFHFRGRIWTVAGSVTSNG